MAIPMYSPNGDHVRIKQSHHAYEIPVQQTKGKVYSIAKQTDGKLKDLVLLLEKDLAEIKDKYRCPQAPPLDDIIVVLPLQTSRPAPPITAT